MALVKPGTASAQAVAQSQAQVDLAYANKIIAAGGVQKYQTRLNNEQAAFNTAITQASNPAQQQAIASKLNAESADVARNAAITNTKTAIADGAHPQVISYYKDEATSAEDYYQSLLFGSEDDFDSFTADIAGSVGLGNLGDITGTDLLDFDDGSAGDTTGATADGQDIVVTGRNRDQRLRIKPFGDGQNLIEQFLGGGDGASSTVLDPLKPTNGVVFPFTPTVTFQSRATYGQVQPTHANQDYYVYSNTPAVIFNIEGKFTAQTREEGLYMLAAMHFFRSATKMRFGAEDEHRGFGPPLLRVHGYGSMLMKNVPVVLLSFGMSLPNDVNYVSIDTDIGEQWVPSVTTFTLECAVQHTASEERDEFNWDEFASGKLLDGGGGWF